MNDSLKKYDYIDAMRGYAILLVILAHSTHAIPPSSSSVSTALSLAGTGVQLFYIASALTLCMSFRFRAALELHPLRNFFIRRFFRIAPMFYLAIVFYLILDGLAPRYWAPDGIGLFEVVSTILFINGVHPEAINSVVPGGWSIAVEMTFYLVLPFVLLRVTSIKSALWFLALSLVIYVAAAIGLRRLLQGAYVQNPHLIDGFIYMNFLSQLPVFAIGIATYFAMGSRFFSPRNLAIGNLLYLTLFVAAFALPEVLRRHITTNHVFISTAYAMVALNLACWPIQVLVNRMIVWIGKISFSMYLSHFAVLVLFAETGAIDVFGSGNAACFAYWLSVVGLTATVSRITYALVELPGIGFGKRLIDRSGHVH
jgi:peptidoglycan/LPS O-acetylase OafA/YrhL